MSDKFKFVQDQLSGKWVVLAPKRASRPNEAVKEVRCPFCPGNEDDTDSEIYRLPEGSEKSKWQIRSVPNKYPFAPVHEVLIHSPNHDANFFNYPPDYINYIFQVYRQRFNANKDKGQVVIFHNSGFAAGESLSHSHTQIPVVPEEIILQVPPIANQDHTVGETKYFSCYLPQASGWPWEVWFLPKRRGTDFGQAIDLEISDLALIFSTVLKKMQAQLGNDFAFNFYISPRSDWYLRLIPREKVIGGFELATDVYVNTVDPSEAAKELSF